MTIQELSKLAIKNENTPELGQYWEKRYEKFLKNKVFILSEKTEQILNQKTPIDSPATPFGYLNLPIFVGKNKIVDEVMLQNSIETSVRFLDSLLDVINFNQDATEIVKQNRKIGLGVDNFESYLTLRDSVSKVEEIDYIGEIISSGAFRASEALAEEKGACENWESLSLLIRPKSFEYWYNTDNGEVKSGLDVAEEYTNTSLVASNFEIIPRRNSHILLYPSDMEWQIWSDRDENSIISNVATIAKAKVDGSNLETELDIPFISTGQDDSGDYLPSFEQSKNIIQSDLPTIGVEQNQNIVENSISDLPLINPITTLQKKISSWFEVNPAGNEMVVENPVSLSEPTLTNNKKPDSVPVPIRSEQPQEISNFEIEDKPLVNDVIKNIQTKVEQNLDETIKNVQTMDLTPKVEVKQEKTIIEVTKPIKLQVVILSSDGKGVLVDADYRLPTVDYTFSQDPEDFVTTSLRKSYNLDVDFVEISSIDLFKEDLYIVYQTKINQWDKTNSSLQLGVIDELTNEEDIVALSKALDRIRRWQKSAKIKAEQIAQDQIAQTTQKLTQENLVILQQKNDTIRDLEFQIKNLGNQNQKDIFFKTHKIDELQSQLQDSVDKQIVPVDIKMIEDLQSQEPNLQEDQELMLVQEIQNASTSLQPQIPNINILDNKTTINETQNNMPNVTTNIDLAQDTFRTSRDKMFMPTLEIETKLGVPMVVHNIALDDDQDQGSTSSINTALDSEIKTPVNSTLNTLLRLKKMTK